MRGVWWTLKLLAGLVLVACLLSVALAVVFPPATQHAGPWLGVLLLSAGVYWVANARLGADAGRPPASHWQGELHVLPAPLLRQAGLCLLLAGLSIGVPLAFVRGGQLSGWQAGLVLLGALLGLWLCRSAIIGFLNLKRAGYALKLDAAGIHYPGLPLLRWTHVTGIALDPPRPDSDRSPSLVLQMRSLPEQPSGLHALWRAALPGARISRHSVSLPLPTLRKPTVLLDAAQALWRRHRVQPMHPEPHSGGMPTPIR